MVEQLREPMPPLQAAELLARIEAKVSEARYFFAYIDPYLD